MLFAIGTKVKFKHTGDEGVVTSILEGEMVNVYLRKEDMDIPAFTDDLIRMDEPSAQKVKAKFVSAKKEAQEPVTTHIPVEIQYAILKSLGIQLAFEGIETKDNLVERFSIYLINDTGYDVLFSLDFLLNRRKKFSWEGKLKATSFVKIGEMLNDELNESPVFKLECRWVTTEGVGEVQSKNLKIKPKSFYNSLRTAPLLNKQVFHYRLFEKEDNGNSKKPKEDLLSYTRRHSVQSQDSNLPLDKMEWHEIKALAEFYPEFDLHIEKLTPLWQRMGKADILRYQLMEFEKFLSKAISLGIQRIYVIHGVGEGRLKEEIASRLLKNREVSHFKNEYHPKYGWGATEIIL